MKKYIILFFFGIFLLTNEANAQHMRPRSERGGGIDQTTYKPKNKKQKDFIEANVDYLEEQLKLDTFQKAAVLSIFNDKRDVLMNLSMLNIPEGERLARSKVITDKINADVLLLLNEKQAEKYRKILEDKEKKALTN